MTEQNTTGLVELTLSEMRDHHGGVAPRYEVDPITGEVRVITCTDIGPFGSSGTLINF